jgi:hypothetical protein
MAGLSRTQPFPRGLGKTKARIRGSVRADDGEIHTLLLLTRFRLLNSCAPRAVAAPVAASLPLPRARKALARDTSLQTCSPIVSLSPLDALVKQARSHQHQQLCPPGLPVDLPL